MKQKRIPELNDLERKAIANIDRLLEDVCEPRVMELKNTRLVLFVLNSGHCYLADKATRIANPDSIFPYGGKNLPAIKLSQTVFIYR